MTTLEIIPDIGRKTARFDGTVAAGEHVEVTIRGAAEFAASGCLGMRVAYGHRTIAEFPEKKLDAEGNVSYKSQWETDGDDAKCVLNLNTVGARKSCRGKYNPCLFVLESGRLDRESEQDGVDPRLLFVAECNVQGWPERIPADAPYDLDEYPSIMRMALDAVRNLSASVTKEGDTATIEISSGVPKKTTTATVKDGFSPTISVTKVQGGHDVSITDRNGTRKVSIKDGVTPTWEDLGGRPESFPPSAHGHSQDDVQGLPEALSGKVDKQDGMGLSSNDFTDTYKVTLSQLPAMISSEASKRTAADKSLASDISGEVARAKAAEESLKSTKVDKAAGMGLSTNDFTDSYRVALDGLDAKFGTKQDKLDANQLAAVNSGITAEKIDQMVAKDDVVPVGAGTEVIATIAGKQIKAPAGGGGGTVTKVANVSPDASGNVPLTAKDVSAVGVDGGEVNQLVVHGIDDSEPGSLVVNGKVIKGGMVYVGSGISLRSYNGEDSITKGNKEVATEEQVEAVSAKVDALKDAVNENNRILVSDTTAAIQTRADESEEFADEIRVDKGYDALTGDTVVKLDKSVQTVTVRGSNLEIVLPDAVPGTVRDFCVYANNSGDADTALTFPPGTYYGDDPNGAVAKAGKVTGIYLSEIPNGVWTLCIRELEQHEVTA